MSEETAGHGRSGWGGWWGGRRRRPAGTPRRRPTVEALEERALLSTLDGSFDAVRLTQLHADPAFEGINGRGVGIAIIDTGVDAQNPEIAPNFVHFYDAVTQTDATAFDPEGHGTHVAGIAASSNP